MIFWINKRFYVAKPSLCISSFIYRSILSLSSILCTKLWISAFESNIALSFCNILILYFPFQNPNTLWKVYSRCKSYAILGIYTRKLSFSLNSLDVFRYQFIKGVSTNSFQGRMGPFLIVPGGAWDPVQKWSLQVVSIFGAVWRPI